MGAPTQITLRDIYRARRRIAGIARRTRLLASPALSEHLGTDVYIKDETQQPTGAFKVRGAASKLLALGEEVRARGVLAVSTGNHGRAVAYVGRRLGVPVTVCVSTKVPRNKRDAIRDLGARLVIHGESQDEAELEGKRLVEEEGLTYVPPFDDADIVAGQGTIGLEILEELPDVRTVVIPLSGGGLAGGIGLALASADPDIGVLGVSMAAGAVMHASLRAGGPVKMPEAETLADSLQGGIGMTNAVTLRLARDHIDEVILVSESAIAQAMRFAFRTHRMVLEGGGAVAIAAAMQGLVEVAVGEGLEPGESRERFDSPPGPVVLVASGGNVDPDAFRRVLGAP